MLALPRPPPFSDDIQTRPCRTSWATPVSRTRVRARGTPADWLTDCTHVSPPVALAVCRRCPASPVPHFAHRCTPAVYRTLLPPFHILSIRARYEQMQGAQTLQRQPHPQGEHTQSGIQTLSLYRGANRAAVLAMRVKKPGLVALRNPSRDQLSLARMPRSRWSTILDSARVLPHWPFSAGVTLVAKKTDLLHESSRSQTATRPLPGVTMDVSRRSSSRTSRTTLTRPTMSTGSRT